MNAASFAHILGGGQPHSFLLSPMDWFEQLDWSLIIWQALVPILAPVIAWLLVCFFKSTLKNTPALGEYLKTGAKAIEEHGWLVYAVLISLQSAVAISSAKSHANWIFWLNLAVLLSSFAILCIAFIARIDDSKVPVSMKSADQAPVQLKAAGGMALAGAIVGYMTMSGGKVL